MTERPCASTACGFSPTARIARPSGVRARTKAVTATVSEGEVGERGLGEDAGERQRREGLDARRRRHPRQRHAVGVGGDGGGEQRDAEADDVLRQAERHGEDAVQQAEGHAGQERRRRRRPRAAAPSQTASQPAKAPTTMMPSMPRLRTPARSQMSSPIVAKISGEAMRTTAAQKLAETRMSRISAHPRRIRKRVSFSAATMVRSAVASRMSAM